MVVSPHHAARVGVVWDAVCRALPGDPPLHIVDLGGGTGGLAVALAGLGHHVTVVDPSPNALAALGRRASEAGLTELVHGVIGDASTLAVLVDAGDAVGGVVCHGVLEVVDDPGQALQQMAAVLPAGGLLSVLVPQQSGAVFARVLAGQFDEAAALLGSDDTDLPRRFSRQGLERLVTDAGFDVSEVRGVRVFSDHVSSRVVDAQPAAAERLGALEAAVCTHADFLPLATQLHLLARRR